MKKIVAVLFSVVAALCLCFGLAACDKNGGGGKITRVLIPGMGINQGSGISLAVGEEEDFLVDYLMDVYGKKPAHELKCTASEEGIVQLAAETDVEFEDEDGDIRDNVDRLTVTGLAPGKTTVTISVGEGEGLSFSFEVVVENYTKGLEYGEADPWGWNTETHGIACIGLGTATETDIHVPSHAYLYGQWLTVSQVKLNKEEDGAKITSVHLPEWTIAVDLAYSHIQSLVLPEGVELLHDNAFKGCSLLEEITLPAGLTQIQDSVFEDCTSLGSLDIPASVSFIGDRAFANCTSLEKLVVPEDCHIGTDFLAGSGVKDLELPYLHPGIWCEWDERLDHFTGLERLAIDLGSYASDLPDAVLTDLKELVVKGGVVDSDKFSQNCHALKSVTFLDQVTSIGANAFKGCENLETVSIGSGLKKVGANVFEGCTKIKEVTAASFFFENLNYYTGSDEPYSFSLGDLFMMSSGASKIKLTIAEGVTGVGPSAIFTRIEELVLPSTLTSIDEEFPAAVSGLSKVSVNGESERFQTQDGVLYFTDKDRGLGILWVDKEASGNVTVLDGVKSIPGNAFLRRTAVTSVSIPAGVTEIGESAFASSGITEIEIPADSELATIGENAFNHSALAAFPATLGKVTEIAYATFGNCKSLTAVDLPESVTTIYEDAFKGCTNLATLTGGENVEYIAAEAFANTAWLAARETQKDTVIYAFHVAYAYFSTNTSQPFDVELEAGTKGVADDAFFNTGLKKVTVPTSVKVIGHHAFGGNRESTSVHFLGTKAEWDSIKKGNAWCTGAPTMTYGAN